MPRTKIFYQIPWNTDKNLGIYYNDAMERLAADDEFCGFVDGDAGFTTHFFGKQVEDIVAKYPECGLFTAVASRMGCIWQRAGNEVSDDMRVHRKIGQRFFDTKYTDITDVSKVDKFHVLGGVFILIRKDIWRKIGKFKETGILGIDNDIHWKAMAADEKVYLANGLYFYHWYRGGNEADKSHLL